MKDGEDFEKEINQLIEDARKKKNTFQEYLALHKEICEKIDSGKCNDMPLIQADEARAILEIIATFEHRVNLHKQQLTTYVDVLSSLSPLFDEWRGVLLRIIKYNEQQ
ncbi:MAG: hypothetical protein JW943_04670 [Deltaproteobacteria bacterium]|nr:hypothetical protein [Deltaproteobacteria bacterium]